MESGGLGRLQAAFIAGLHQGFDARQLKPRKDWATQDRQSFAHIPVADRTVAQPVANLRDSATSVNLVKSRLAQIVARVALTDGVDESDRVVPATLQARQAGPDLLE